MNKEVDRHNWWSHWNRA